MLEKHRDTKIEDMKDPLLSVLLREALTDDPALAPAPGRTDRIMRKVLASGVRPAPRRVWAPMAWATGTLATAAAVLVLVFSLAHQPKSGEVVGKGSTPKPPIVDATDPKRPAVSDDTLPAPAPPQLREMPRQEWKQPEQLAKKPEPPKDLPKAPPIKNPEPLKNPAPAAPENTNADTTRTQVAATLYSTGSTALQTGDYQTAYEAYEAAYKEDPTPHTLMASAKALEQLSREALTADGSQI